MQLIVDLTEKSVKNLHNAVETAEALGMMRRTFSPEYLDLFDAFKKEVIVDELD